MTKIVFDIAGFAEAAKAIRSVADSSAKIDLLECARLEAEGGRMFLTMSSLDLEARIMLDCQAEAPVLAAVPGAVLEFFISRAGRAAEDKGTLEFDEDLRNVVARHAKAKMSIAILRGQDFPAFPAAEPDWSFSLPAHALTAMLALTERAVAVSDPARAFLEGVFFGLLEHRDGDGVLVAVATDGHRLHQATMEMPDIEGAFPRRDGGRPGIIVPRQTIVQMLSIFGDDESGLKLSGTASRLTVEGERIRLISKLIDGTYPDWPRAMPEPDEAGAFTIGGKLLDEALARLTVIPRTNGKGQKETTRAVRITPEADGQILLEMKGDTGMIEDRLPSTTKGGEPVSFNVRLVRDLVASIGDVSLTFAPGKANRLGVRVTVPREGADFCLFQRMF